MSDFAPYTPSLIRKCHCVQSSKKNLSIQCAVRTERTGYSTTQFVLPDTNAAVRTLKSVLTASTVAFAHSWPQQKGLSDTVRFVLEEISCLWECESQVSPQKVLNNRILRIIVIVAMLKGKACGDNQQPPESMAPLREGSSRVIFLEERNLHSTTSINLPVDLPSISFLCY